MKLLLIGDLHATDRPRDAYRLRIFEQIQQWQQQYRPDATFIMGDICDAKDRHSAGLVNLITEELAQLTPINVIMGNHDYIDPQNPFFGFTNLIKGIRFINRPIVLGTVAAIPHCKTQEQFDSACDEIGDIDCILAHNTFSGAISETGKKLTGLSIGAARTNKIYAGDIHRPQTLGKIKYVGAPYHIRFGDDFKPRCLLIDGNSEKDLYFPAPCKWKLTIKDPAELQFCKAEAFDHVKITLELSREEVTEWRNYRQQIMDICKKYQYEVHGIDLKINTIKKQTKDVKLTQTPTDILAQFCKHEGVGMHFKEAGLSILKDV